MTARRVPGEAGIWLVVMADVLVFLILFGTYLHYLGQEPELFRQSQRELTPAFGVIDTVLLLTSSLAVVTGVRAHRASDPEAAGRALAVGIGLGCVFVVSKGIEWTHVAHAGNVPDDNDFFSLYFILTGLHLFHVLIGLFVLAVVRGIARRAPVREQDAGLVESGGAF